MKNIMSMFFLVVLSDIFSCNANSEPMWTWVSGSSDGNQIGVYGTKGEANPYNVPGSRIESISWIDISNNLWLFGGHDIHMNGFNDLWKFDGTNWTWVSGSNTTNQYGIYGTKGVPASNNVPGARYRSVSWIDYNGNLWLFGGYGCGVRNDIGYLNDLWKFDGSNWIWVSGPNSVNQGGVYGTKGIASPDNVPGGRESSVSWIDSSGNLWLFGGYGLPSYGYKNDLWKFDGTNWTWVSGANYNNQHGVYGTKGVASPDNVPGGRDDSVSWIDHRGNLWLFGGHYYFESSGSWYLNDLWKFDGTNWTWVSGSNLTNQYGVYGIKGMAASDNVPGARSGVIGWIDSSGDFWLFGGYGYAVNGNTGTMNDLWKFDETNWTWVSGSDITRQPGVYGEKGIPAPDNVPGARGACVSWIDASDNLWLFGGTTPQIHLNDLWKFGISENAADIDGDGMINFIDFSILSSQWLQTPGNPSADIAPSPAGDGLVNILDLAEFSLHWLETI